jgi:hypothetical protein
MSTDNVEENPFKLPSDDKIFRKREEEKRKKDFERTANRGLKIWEKSKTEAQSRSGRLLELTGKTKTTAIVDVINANQPGKVVAPRRAEKENMTDFIAKKREMFLVQMSLDTKREEIRKLEEKAQMKEEALQRSEQMLEEDAMRFDAFLKENDKKAHDAIKKAEEETKRKQEKTHEIKRLTQQIQALNSEMSKHRESLEDCLRYQEFLDMLTPSEWFQDYRDKREKERQSIMKAQYDAKYKEWEKMRRRLVEAHLKEQAAKQEQRKRERRRGGGDDDDKEDEEDKGPAVPLPPKLEDEVVELPEEEPPMYFVEPKQLMDIFASLEEQNLFLIQNNQETERTLEELRHAYEETRRTMDSRTESLDAQITELQTSIQEQERLSKELAHSKNAAAGGDAEHKSSSQSEATSDETKERLLAVLNAKVSSVCDACGIDVSSKPATLFMLSSLESKLETLLMEIETMPIDYVIKVEKEKDKKRREKKREEQQLLQIRQQEERNRRAIERSMQAPKKRSGRQIMQRSRPVRREATKKEDTSDEVNTDELKFMSE